MNCPDCDGAGYVGAILEGRGPNDPAAVIVDVPCDRCLTTGRLCECCERSIPRARPDGDTTHCECEECEAALAVA